MGIVVSLTDARAERVKVRLLALDASRSPAMVETAEGLIDAQRIFCRDAVAILIDRYGCQNRLGYDQITDVSPLMSTADIIERANWQITELPAQQAEAATSVVPFPASRAVDRATRRPA